MKKHQPGKAGGGWNDDDSDDENDDDFKDMSSPLRSEPDSFVVQR